MHNCFVEGQDELQMSRVDCMKANLRRLGGFREKNGVTTFTLKTGTRVSVCLSVSMYVRHCRSGAGR